MLIVIFSGKKHIYWLEIYKIYIMLPYQNIKGVKMRKFAWYIQHSLTKKQNITNRHIQNKKYMRYICSTF